jgi:hypothetical protein
MSSEGTTFYFRTDRAPRRPERTVKEGGRSGAPPELGRSGFTTAEGSGEVFQMGSARASASDPPAETGSLVLAELTAGLEREMRRLGMMAGRLEADLARIDLLATTVEGVTRSLEALAKQLAETKDRVPLILPSPALDETMALGKATLVSAQGTLGQEPAAGPHASTPPAPGLSLPATEAVGEADEPEDGIHLWSVRPVLQFGDAVPSFAEATLRLDDRDDL